MSFNFQNNKLFFVGISLGSNTSIESGAAVLDTNLNIITLDKLFTIDDVKYMLDNFVGKLIVLFDKVAVYAVCR